MGRPADGLPTYWALISLRLLVAAMACFAIPISDFASAMLTSSCTSRLDAVFCTPWTADSASGRRVRDNRWLLQHWNQE